MFTKFDKWFEQTAAYLARRRVAITDYSRRHTFFFWLAVVWSALALAVFLVSIFSASKPGETGGVASLRLDALTNDTRSQHRFKHRIIFG
jgi:hypothetical protein